MSKAETQKQAFCLKCSIKAKNPGRNMAGTRHNLGCPLRPKKGAEGLGSSGYLIVVPADSAETQKRADVAVCMKCGAEPVGENFARDARCETPGCPGGVFGTRAAAAEAYLDKIRAAIAAAKR